MITLCMYWYDVNVYLYEKNSKSGPCGYLYMDKQLKVFHLYLLTLFYVYDTITLKYDNEPHDIFTVIIWFSQLFPFLLFLACIFF